MLESAGVGQVNPRGTALWGLPHLKRAVSIVPLMSQFFCLKNGVLLRIDRIYDTLREPKAPKFHGKKINEPDEFTVLLKHCEDHIKWIIESNSAQSKLHGQVQCKRQQLCVSFSTTSL